MGKQGTEPPLRRGRRGEEGGKNDEGLRIDKNSSRASDGRLDLGRNKYRSRSLVKARNMIERKAYLGDDLGDPRSISGELELNPSSTSNSPILTRSR